MKTTHKNVHVRIPTDLVDALDAVAANRPAPLPWSRSALIREAVQAHLERFDALPDGYAKELS